MPRRLKDALFGDSDGDSAPCFIVSGCAVERDATKPSPEEVRHHGHHVTYAHASAACAQHEQWLEAKVHSMTTSPFCSTTASATVLNNPTGARAASDDVVLAYLASNTMDAILSIVAATSLPQAPPALLNTRWTVSELVAAVTGREVVATSTCRPTTILVCTHEYQAMAQQVVHILSGVPHCHYAAAFGIPHFCDTTRGAMYGSRHHPRPPTTIAPRDRPDDSDADDAVIVFTSGTSGHAKGVRLSHRALIVQCRAKLAAPCSYTHETRLVGSTVPLCHVGGLSSLGAVLLARGTILWPDTTSSSFDPAGVCRALSHNHAHAAANTLVVVPTMLYALQEYQTSHTTVRWYDTVTLIVIGGQSASSDLLDYVRSVFGRARIVQTYACTEAASSLTFWTVPRHWPRPPLHGGDCVGWPLAHVQLGIAVSTRGDDTSQQPSRVPWTVGVIVTRGPHVMNGYWVRGGGGPNTSHRRTVATDHGDAWMRTSDVGYLDETGCLFLLGRVSDSIRTGGETVMATEVERVLQAHPAVVDCAVLGVRDDKFGETVCGVIVTTSEQPRWTVDAVRQWCAQQGLAGYKRPRRIVILDTPLPRNSSGKVLKYELKKRFDSENDSQATVRSKL